MPSYWVENRVTYLLFLCLALPVQAGNVVVNEIAWMGTETSANDEWIELYNNSDNDIDLEGWLLKADDEKPLINLTGSIKAKDFYLLERTGDEAVPGIPADLIYTGALENSGETLQLYDNSENLIDSVNCSDEWSAGDNATKQTMERKGLQEWQTSQSPGGTPKAKNSAIMAVDSPQSAAEDNPQQTYPSGIIINEVLPSPEGPDAENEWIELYNQNSFAVDLAGWEITDTIGATKSYTFPENTIIQPKDYLVLLRPVSKIVLNNTADGLKLSQPDKNTLDSLTYEKAPQGESFNKTGQGWAWSNAPSPGEENIIPKLITETQGEENDSQKKEDYSSQNLAALAEQVTAGKTNPFFLFVALPLALISAIIILILKKKIKSNPL